EPAARAGGAEAPSGLQRRLLPPGVTGQAEVVVRPDHDHPPPLDVDLGAGVRGFDGPEVRIEAGGLGDLVVLESTALVEHVAHVMALLPRGASGIAGSPG